MQGEAGGARTSLDSDPTGGVVAPDERLPRSQILVAGVQYATVMFGATGLCPLLVGF